MFVVHVMKAHGAKIYGSILSCHRREIKLNDLIYVNVQFTSNHAEDVHLNFSGVID
jgi:hypothetical protein